MTNSNFYVYEHWRPDKNECFYVGKGKNNRAYTRKSRNSHWRNIVKKLERIGLTYEVRIISFELTEEAAFELEKERIAIWRDVFDLANMTDGGGGLFNPSEEVRAKLSSVAKTLLGEKNPFYGRKHSLETKTKISAIKKQQPSNRKGVKVSVETLARMSAAQKGRVSNRKGIKLSEEVKANMAKAQQQRYARAKGLM